jgi:hypothetical protein
MSYEDLEKAKAERAVKETAKEAKKVERAVKKAIREAKDAEKDAKKAAREAEQAITGKSTRSRKHKRSGAEDVSEPKAKVARMSDASEQEMVPVMWSEAHVDPVPVVWTSDVQVHLFPKVA